MTKPRIAVSCAMRNEGQFVLEWVAYFREMGFDEIIVMSNDCTDGTDKLLDRLAEMGELTHVDNVAMGDASPLARMITRALDHDVVKGCDWLMLCDADEFPVVTHGMGRIHDLVAAMPGHTDCIAMHWRAFGSAGPDFPAGGNVLEVCRRAQDEPEVNGFHKCLFRPNKFRAAHDHLPKEPYGPVVVRNTAGVEMNPVSTTTEHTRFRHSDPSHWTFEGGAMYHYAIRADDIFMMKNDRGDGRDFNNTKYYLHSGFYTRFNRQEVEDMSLTFTLPDVLDRKAQYLADPVLKELHDTAVATYQDQKARVLTPEQRRKWSKTPKNPAPKET